METNILLPLRKRDSIVKRNAATIQYISTPNSEKIVEAVTIIYDNIYKTFQGSDFCIRFFKTHTNIVQLFVYFVRASPIINPTYFWMKHNKISEFVKSEQLLWGRKLRFDFPELPLGTSIEVLKVINLSYEIYRDYQSQMNCFSTAIFDETVVSPYSTECVEFDITIHEIMNGKMFELAKRSLINIVAEPFYECMNVQNLNGICHCCIRVHDFNKDKLDFICYVVELIATNTTKIKHIVFPNKERTNAIIYIEIEIVELLNVEKIRISRIKK